MNNYTSPVVDADGHVLEPADLWLEYIDPAFRDRAIRIDTDENGWEVLLFDNNPSGDFRRTRRYRFGRRGTCRLSHARK